MSLRKIELRHVALPLKMKIKHASREREISDNLIVAATLDSGETGYGEGVPRSYVTGETIETAFATLRSFDFSKHMGRPATFLDVIRKLESLELPETANDPRGMAGNSARCAFELAILDAYGHKFGLSLGDAATLVKADPVKGVLRQPMSATVERSHQHRLAKSASLRGRLGFTVFTKSKSKSESRDKTIRSV